MTPDESFARWVKISLSVFAAVFGYFLLADLWAPVTPHARLMRPVVQIAPQTSGQVTQVLVQNNQQVAQGQLLFTLDAQAQTLALEKAQLALQTVQQHNRELDAAIASAQAALEATRVRREQLHTERDRLVNLADKGQVSRQAFDNTQANYKTALATEQQARADLTRLQTERGREGADNLSLHQARNTLQQAKLALSYTQVRAAHRGITANMQLQPGAYVTAAKPVMSLIKPSADIVADFREKSLTHLQPGSQASVSFDALPGQVFAARVSALESGVADGQLSPSGLLINPEQSDRWVRDAQRQRLHLTLTDAALPATLPSGARATVQLYHGAGITAWLAHMQIRVLSALHYLY